MPVGHAELICYPLEAALIGRRGEIVADRDRGKAARDAFCAQLVDFQRYIGCECFRDLATVDDFRSHPVLRSGVSLARAAQCCAMAAASAAAACAWLIRGSPGPPRVRHRHTRGRVLRVARSVVWTCRSTLGLAEPPFSSPHTR